MNRASFEQQLGVLGIARLVTLLEHSSLPKASGVVCKAWERCHLPAGRTSGITAAHPLIGPRLGAGSWPRRLTWRQRELRGSVTGRVASQLMSVPAVAFGMSERVPHLDMFQLDVIKICRCPPLHFTASYGPARSSHQPDVGSYAFLPDKGPDPVGDPSPARPGWTLEVSQLGQRR